MDSVSEFHFVDRDELPVLPSLHCRGDREAARLGSDTSHHYTFPTEIVSSARRLSASHPAFVQQARIYDSGSYTGEKHVNYASADEIWTVTSNYTSRVRIYSHRFDEIESLKALDAISVFYCPGLAPQRTEHYFFGGKSQGEQAEAGACSLRLVKKEEEYIAPGIFSYEYTGREDRRSQWFTPQNSVKVLDKLNDGGIIIAGACLPARCDLLWRRLARTATRLGSISERNRRPENFTYANRRFRCLGECGYRNGPVFAWQVYRLP